MTLAECMMEENFGTLPIDLSNTLEKEAIDYCHDNPLQFSRSELDDVSFGMKRMSLTSAETSSDVSDYLHMHINVSATFMFKIATRIFCFGFDEEPTFKMDKTAPVKDRIEQA